MKELMTKRVINQTTRKKLSVKMTPVIVALLLSMLSAATGVYAEDWKGVDITNLSMTGDGYFEAPISENALSDLKGRGVSVSGVGFTLVSVDLIKSDGTLRQNVFSGTYVANTWSNKSPDIDKSKFSNAEVGDYLRCTFTDKVTSGDNSYNPKFYKGNSWEDFPELQNRIYKDGVSSSEVYIYNVETGKFMYIGGDWGVKPELTYRDFGLKFKMKTDGNRYLFTSDVFTQGNGSTTGNHLGMMQGYIGSSAISNGITVDKRKATLAGKNGDGGPMYCYSRFKIERLPGETGDTYTYVLSLRPKEYDKNSYQVSNGSRDVYDQIPDNTYYLTVVDGLRVVETTDASATGHWRFVSVSEIDAAVRNNALDVDAFNGMNLDITYKIDNQGFNRNNENDWDETGATYLKKSDGDIYKLKDPEYNGKYYYGLMSSASDGGFISRGFYAPATGWYKVQCQGVSKSGNAYAFAKANGNDAVYAPLNKAENVLSYNEIVSDEHKQDRVDLGIDFYNNEYPVEVYFHAAEGDYIMIGIQQMVGYANDLTAFDDFQIKFLGEVFVLDEDYETCEHADESGNGNGYLDAHEGVTVILHRTFSKKDDGTYYWNTLTLPINMTGTQVKNVFGDDVKLAVASGLDQSDPYVITFQSVDADNGIQAGQFYLIQPAKEPATPAGQTITINNKTYNGPLYTLGRRDVNPISADLFNDDGWNAPNHNSIRYHGTYLKLENGVPARSYVFSKGDMYHTKTAQTIKGFRFWIEDEEAAQGGSAKPFTLSIGGVEDQQEAGQIITTISEVETVTSDNAAVYSLSGQFLGKGKQLLNSLPKGIYVVNNKKYMVK